MKLDWFWWMQFTSRKFKFNKNYTSKGKFWISADNSKEIDFMKQEKRFPYANIEELDARVLKMFYENSDVSFIILLPHKRNGLADLESKLSTFNLNEIDDHVQARLIDVKIPKFKAEFNVDATDALQKVQHICHMPFIEFSEYFIMYCIVFLFSLAYAMHSMIALQTLMTY